MTLLTDDTDLSKPKFDSNTAIKTPRVYPLRDEIRDACKKACNQFGGVALVDDHYAFVDLRVMEVTYK